LWGDKWKIKGSIDPAIGQVPEEGYDENDVSLHVIK
jgi:hypothetical protein